MENTTELNYQPAGWAGFGWGLLGYFGGALIIQGITLLGMMIVIPLMSLSDIWGLLAFPAVATGIYCAVIFKNSRRYQATSTGVGVAIILNCIAFVLQFIIELARASA